MRHLFPSDRIAGLLDANRGLTADEVEQRQRLYGSNDILGDRRSGWGDIARDTARDPMVWLLVATAFLFAWLGDYIEASVLALALVPIAGMDAYLHRRTQATTEGLAGPWPRKRVCCEMGWLGKSLVEPLVAEPKSPLSGSEIAHNAEAYTVQVICQQ